MRRWSVVLAAFFYGETALAGDSLCLSKYKLISDQFYIYNEKSAVPNAIMDRIATYTDGSDLSKIHDMN